VGKTVYLETSLSRQECLEHLEAEAPPPVVDPDAWPVVGKRALAGERTAEGFRVFTPPLTLVGPLAVGQCRFSEKPDEATLVTVEIRPCESAKEGFIVAVGLWVTLILPLSLLPFALGGGVSVRFFLWLSLFPILSIVGWLFYRHAIGVVSRELERILNARPVPEMSGPKGRKTLAGGVSPRRY